MKYGLIGEKLSHSLSPEIHRIISELTGKKGDYGLFELSIEELQPFLLNASDKGFNGLNVTIPYKTKVISYIDELSEEAMKIGAVNTIMPGSLLKGYNTDYYGIDYTLRKYNESSCWSRALVLGSGGAANAVIAYLEDNERSSVVSKIYLASRDKIAAKNKFQHANTISYEEIVDYSPFDLIVNTTPVGMFPLVEASPLTKEQIKGSSFLFDLIYNPAKTRLMELSDELGIPNVNGLYMLVAQAVKAQEIWNGEEYGQDLVDAVYLRFLGERA
ncbi:MAG: shikimate dehydrogenase [Ruminiclostridium sp.]|nr:shikimate dehydrogenase [Ruminiclostridium sp.]